MGLLNKIIQSKAANQSITLNEYNTLKHIMASISTARKPCVEGDGSFCSQHKDLWLPILCTICSLFSLFIAHFLV